MLPRQLVDAVITDESTPADQRVQFQNKSIRALLPTWNLWLIP